MEDAGQGRGRRQRARLRLRPLPPKAFVIAGVAVAVVLAGCSGGGSGNKTAATTPARQESRATESPPASPTPATTGPGSTAADVLVIAHRGASAYAPQNTVAAAREAVSRGADALEADIRQTRDGHLVALLSPSLAPTTNIEQVFPQRRPWQVESFTLAEVRRLDAGSWFGPEFAGDRVPTLSELADALDGSDVKMIVDVKAPAPVSRDRGAGAA